MTDHAHSPQPAPDFRLLFEATPLPYLVLTPDYRIVAVNDAYLRATMVTRENLLGKLLFEAFPDNPADPDANGVRNLRNSLDRVRASKSTDVLPIQKYDIPVRSDSPTTRFEVRYWSPANTPVLDEQGELIYLIHRVEDVTAEILERRAVEESEARFRQIADAMPQIVWSALPDGHHDYYNRQYYEFTGVAPGGNLGQEWDRIFHPDDQERTWTLWRHSLATGEPYEIEYRMRHRSGQYRWVLGRALPIRNEAGDIVRWMGTCTDVHEWKLTRAKLEDAQHRVEAALTAAEIGTWTWHVEDDRVNADRNLARMFQVSDSDADGGPIAAYFAAIHPDDVAGVRAAVDESLATGKLYQNQFRLLLDDGSLRYVHARGKVEHDADGKPSWLIGVAIDITQQRLAEQARRRTESKFRTITESNAIGIVQYRADGCLTDPNEAFLHMLGYSGGEFAQAKPSWRGLIPVQIDGPERARWEAFLEKGETEPFEATISRRDGSALPVYLGAAKLEQADGEGIAYVLDISESRRAQLALKESEAEFRTLAENIPQLAWMADSSGRIYWYNNRWFEYTGTTLEEMQAWGWEKVHHADYLESVKAKYIEAMVVRQAIWEDTFPLRAADGSYRWFLSRAMPIRDQQGRIVRWLGTNTDVTVQREAEEALQQANRRKDEFLAMLAHELRNPLAPISTAAQLLRMNSQDANAVQRASAIISRQVKHMTDLVDDLLDVSRVTRGLVSIEQEEVDIKAVLGGAVEQSSPVIEARRHVLSTRLASGQPLVLGDRTRLTQVFTNLLNNAAKYTPQGGEIRLNLDLGETSATITVSDSGVGIDAALLPHVFELFTQAERTPDRSQGGLGLGLALVKSIVDLHGGRVAAHSEGPGKGSSFTVVLPLLEQEPAGQAAFAPEGDVAGAGRALRILLVDDNEDAVRSLAAILEASGHQLRVCLDAHSALADADAAPPDVFILDIGLPDLDGYELSRRLHARPRNREACYIALSGYGQANDKVLAKSAGFDHYLVKPVDLDVLQSLLRRAAQPRGLGAPPRAAAG